MAAEQIDALSLEITSNLNTANLDKLISKLNELGKTLDGLKGKSVAVNIRETGTASTEAAEGVNKLTNSFASQAIKITAVIAVYRKLYSVISSGIANSSAYIKTLNMFNTSLGEYADNATKYGETVSNALGIDIAGWQETQGVFDTLIKGMGVTGDKAAYMSQNLTQLTYDISSFYGITQTEAANKLKSALAGRTQPTRTLGYTVDQAQAVDYAKNPANYGKQTFSINQQTGAIEANTRATDDNTQHKIVNFNQLLSSEKAIIRYNLLMTQNTQVQGNFARALNDPYNQLKIFKEQVNQTSRAFGNMFIPALNQVLPYLSAFTQLATEAFKSLAQLFGFKIPDMKDRTSIDTKPYDHVVKATGQGAKNAKKMKDYMLGIDELNVFNPNTGAGGGSGSAGGQNSNLKNMKLQGYDFLSKAIQSSIEEAKKNIKKFFADLKANPFLLDDIFKWGAGELGSNFWEGLLGKSPTELAKDAAKNGRTIGEQFCVQFAASAGELGSDIWSVILGKSPEKFGQDAKAHGNTVGEELLFGITEKLNEMGFQSTDSMQTLLSDIFGTPEQLGKRAADAGRTVGEQFNLEFHRTMLKFFSYNPISQWFYKLATGNDMNADIQKLEEKLGISGKDIGKSFGNAFSAGVTSTTGKAKTAGTKLGNASASGANSAKAPFKTAGENAGSGFILGINSKHNILEYKKSGDVVAKTTLKALKDFLLIKSPSRKAMGYGELTGEGYAIGVENSIKYATKAATNLASSALSAMSSASDLSNRIITGTVADPMSRANVAMPSSANVGYGIAGANGEAMASLASSVYQAVVSGMATANLNGDRETNIIIDGKQVFKAVETEKRKRGVAVGNGTFSR